MQFSDEMDEDEIRNILGERADAFLKLTPQERFAETVQGVKFDVYGITQQLAKAQDFKKLMTLMQTIGGSDILMEAFLKRYSIDEFITEAMRALGVNSRRLEISHDERELMSQKPQEQRPQAGQAEGQMSQVQSPNTGTLADQMGSQAGAQAQAQAAAPQPAGQQSFPPSKATSK
jgi:hypothetical protein